MIVVDTSVWIPYLHGIRNEKVDRLSSVDDLDMILVGDLILLEILQGARSDAVARTLQQTLAKFNAVPLSSPGLAVKAAANYRHLRGLGITVRKTVDAVIATYCIENGHWLLHQDRDFDHFQRHLGLNSY